MTKFDPHVSKQGEGYYKPRVVPHFDLPGKAQFITFRLADATPQLKSGADFDMVEEVADKGLGKCLLSRPECSQEVVKVLEWGRKDRYQLIAYSIMPNHVHVLIVPNNGFTVSQIVQGWKSVSSRGIEKSIGIVGEIWQKDYFDRYMRDEDQTKAAVNYIVMNPVKAGLCERPEDWRFSWCLGW